MSIAAAAATAHRLWCLPATSAIASGTPGAGNGDGVAELTRSTVSTVTTTVRG